MEAVSQGLYGPEWATESREVRKRFFHRCVRCWWRRSQHAHHTFRRRWAPKIGLCSYCHMEIHRTDKRTELIPLWLDTFLCCFKRWVVNVFVLAGVIAFLYMHA